MLGAAYPRANLFISALPYTNVALTYNDAGVIVHLIFTDHTFSCISSLAISTFIPGVIEASRHGINFNGLPRPIGGVLRPSDPLPIHPVHTHHHLPPTHSKLYYYPTSRLVPPLSTPSPVGVVCGTKVARRRHQTTPTNSAPSQHMHRAHQYHHQSTSTNMHSHQLAWSTVALTSSSHTVSIGASLAGHHHPSTLISSQHRCACSLRHHGLLHLTL